MDSDSAYYENIGDIIYTPATHLRVENKAVNQERGVHVGHLKETSDTENEDKSSLPVRSSPKRANKKILLIVISIVVLIVVCAVVIGFFVLQATTKNTNELVKFQICFHCSIITDEHLHVLHFFLEVPNTHLSWMKVSMWAKYLMEDHMVVEL
jgi:Na+/glutamate symporter